MDKIDKFLNTCLAKTRENEGYLQEKECPSEEKIACYLDNLLNADERAEVEEHLVKCENCLQLTISLYGLKSETKENSAIKTPAEVKAGHGINNRACPLVSTLPPNYA
jgi:hypothetical protein|tara:strand:- start:173 stop:496 length:324 start_codon:yes stop_codon:yes gene_type:complete